AGEEFGRLVAAIINDGLVKALETRSGVRRDVFEVERLEDVHHEVGARMFDDPLNFNTPWSSAVRGQLRFVRHNSGGTLTRGCLLDSCGFCDRGRYQCSGARCCALQKTTTIDRFLFGFHGGSPTCPYFSFMICCSRGISFASGGLLNVLM